MVYEQKVKNMGLSDFSDKELRDELIRRRMERMANRLNEVRCKNCAHQIIGYTRQPSAERVNLVCEMKPKVFQSRFQSTPEYLRTYYRCENVPVECEMFVNKRSEEGRDIALKRERTNADRFDEY